LEEDWKTKTLNGERKGFGRIKSGEKVFCKFRGSGTPKITRDCIAIRIAKFR
jgi:hypothetical protein